MNAKNSKKKQNRRNLRNRRKNMAAVGFVVLLLCGVVTFKKIDLNAKAAGYKQQLKELTQEKKAEEKRADELDDYKEYAKSREYIEKQAREKLGLAYPDEIIFRADDES